LLTESIDHPTEAQLEAFRTNGLDSQAHQEIDVHLQDCPACRAKLITKETALIPAIDAQSHLSFEQLEAYVDRKVPPDQRAALAAHLERCAQCRRELADLARFSRPPTIQTPARRLRLIESISAIAAASLIAIGMWIYSRLPAEYSALVDRTLAAKTVEIPDAVRAIQPRRTDTDFLLRSPQATAVLTAQPEFSWHSAGPAARYTVFVFDRDQERVAQSDPLTDETWRPSKPLPPGRMYQWQVRVEDDGQTATTASAQFLVVDAAATKRLLDIAHRYPDQHLLLGILYAQAGALDESENEFLGALPKSAVLLDYMLSVRRSQARISNRNPISK
jgi:hypothetical protein